MTSIKSRDMHILKDTTVSRYGVNSIFPIPIPLNSIWSIPIPPQIYQLQFRFFPFVSEYHTV